MKYVIKPLEWWTESFSKKFERYYSNTVGYYWYTIVRFIDHKNEFKEDGELNWSKWRLDIRLNNKFYHPRESKYIYSSSFESLDAAFAAANNHNEMFLSVYLEQAS